MNNNYTTLKEIATLEDVAKFYSELLRDYKEEAEKGNVNFFDRKGAYTDDHAILSFNDLIKDLEKKLDQKSMFEYINKALVHFMRNEMTNGFDDIDKYAEMDSDKDHSTLVEWVLRSDLNFKYMPDPIKRSNILRLSQILLDRTNLVGLAVTQFNAIKIVYLKTFFVCLAQTHSNAFEYLSRANFEKL